MSFRRFMNRNLVAIVILPTIVGVHWVCNKIQNIDELVSESERKELPIIVATRYVKDGLVEKYNGYLGDKKST